MNEQRLQVYYQLIDALLKCSSGEEAQILNANQDLLDAWLVLVMAQAAEMLEHRGAKDRSKFLIKLARQISDELQLSLSTSTCTPLPTLNSQLRFFVQVYQVTEQSKSNPEAVYSLLKENLNLLNDYFTAVWKDWVMGMIPDVASERGRYVAAVISNFSVLINDFPLGNVANNLEIAIAGYEIAATVFNRSAFPFEWANSQNNLGAAYCERIRGKRAENLEKAIRYLSAALEVRIRKADPEKWAETQNNLGLAYSEHIKGEKAENLEQAIRCFKAALEIRKQSFSPQAWAQTLYNLGSAYQERVREEKAENIEIAICCYLAALEVYTRPAFPQYWADTQNKLGTAYLHRLKGEKPKNLEKAISYYSAALEVHTRESFPQRWAAIHNNIANVYIYYIWGNRDENLEVAILCCETALKEYTCLEFPEQWALLQNNLGNAYIYRIRGDRTQNLETAILHYLAALGVRTRTDFPQDYAVTQYNLGLAYQEALQFVNACNAFAAAIEIIESLRTEITFGSGIQGDKQKLAEEWIKLYQGMIEVCLELGNTIKAIEYVERSKARNLVELLATRDRYPKGDIPETVLNELNRLRREITAEQRSLEIQERTRHRLGDLMLPERSAETGYLTNRDRLNQLQQQLDKLIAHDIAPIDPDFSLTQKVEPIPYSEIQALTGENTAILEWYILGDKFLTFIITPQSQTPIIWQSTPEDFQDLINWRNEYLKAYLTDKNQWQQTLTSRLQRLAEILHLDDIICHIPQECDRLILIPHRFLHLFPLHVLPLSDVGAKHSGRGSRKQTTNPDPNASPFSGTQPKQTSSNLPISVEGEAFALKNFGEKTEVIDANASPLQGLCLLDRFPCGVGYAPSCQLLQQAKNRQRPNFTHLFAIQNPTFDLTYTDLEVQTIQQHFHPRDVLVKNEAKKSAIDPQRLSNAHCAHFSCHGYFNFNQPLLSALLLADSQQDEKTLDLTKCLTLDDLFGLDLSQCRLVVLSACETGLTDLTSISDEYIGLPSGFLVAGSPSVVSSLWIVSDLSTALLTIKFYENLQTSCRAAINRISLALNQAQKWLRNLTCEEFEAVLERLKPQIAQILTQLPAGKRFVFEDAIEEARKEIRDRQPYPFANPFYWAAFTATGF